jgi:hypothetical protein
VEEDSKDDCKDDNKELKRLQFYGAGPKMAISKEKDEEKRNNKSINYDFDPVSHNFPISTRNHVRNILVGEIRMSQL